MTYGGFAWCACTAWTYENIDGDLFLVTIEVTPWINWMYTLHTQLTLLFFGRLHMNCMFNEKEHHLPHQYIVWWMNTFGGYPCRKIIQFHQSMRHCWQFLYRLRHWEKCMSLHSVVLQQKQKWNAVWNFHNCSCLMDMIIVLPCRGLNKCVE